MDTLEDIFGQTGALSRVVEGYQPRQQQLDMAEAVARAMQSGGHLVVEAGTGTGKTFGYLVPALLSGQRTVVSTGTRTLQDQLFHRDLPVISQAIGRPLEVALLKGRANYLCKYRMQQAVDEATRPNAAHGPELVQIKRWSAQTHSGDVSELSQVSEQSPVWPRVTSTSENCLGSRCPDYDSCFVVRARRAAQEADVVIVNHHLLLADQALKEEGFGELLPGADTVIVDEAHQLPEVAAQFFGESVSSRQLLSLAHDAMLETMGSLGTRSVPESEIAGVERAVRELRLALGREAGRLDWEQADAAANAMDQLATSLEALQKAVFMVEDSGPGLRQLCQRVGDALARWNRLSAPDYEDGLRWWELSARGFILRMTPFDVSETLSRHIQSCPSNWIFTSATLAVGDSFSHFVKRVGLESPTTLKVDSPFDFSRQAMLYLPRGLPAPSSFEYTRKVMETAEPLLRASGGRAFLLFTSHRALREAVDWWERNEPMPEVPVLVQGTLPRDQLLERFRTLGNAVLFGTASFWEGVDVRGEALSVVMIEKLPFASPGDPVTRARIQAIENAGGNAFREHQLPQAVIALKQGVGRLIRDVEDTGVVMICDPRVTGSGYGKVFLSSLPEMPRTGELEKVVEFLSSHDALRVNA
jgi:ATP-dependent DNA helicase DinG